MNQAFLDQKEAFLNQICEDKSPVHKLVFADWLEERGKLDEAYAYRWSGMWDKHPRKDTTYLYTPGDPSYVWMKCKPHPAEVDSHRIPRLVYVALIGGRDEEGGHVKRYRSLEAAFLCLADALNALRRDVARPNGR